MKTPITLPDLGSDDQPIRLVQWLVDTGDHVLEGDRAAEVLVGGVLFHVPSPAEGTVERLVNTGDAPLRPDTELGHIVS